MHVRRSEPKRSWTARWGRSGRWCVHGAMAAVWTTVCLTTAQACGPSETEPDDVDADAGDGSAGDGSTEVSLLDAGGPPPVPPDGAVLCPSGICNYQTQEGCAPDLACRPVVDDAGNVEPGCVAAGDRLAGEPCAAWTDCAPGLLCAEEACRQLCCGGDWSACSEEESCIRQLSIPVHDTTVRSGASLCYPVGACDVLDPSSCADEEGRTCQIVDLRGKVACAPEGVGQAGDFCSTSTPCMGGFACVASSCRRLCRMVEGGEPACPEDEGTCVHFTRDPPGVGECTPL